MARKVPFKPLSREEQPDFLSQLSKLEGVDHAEFPALSCQVAERYHDAVIAGDVGALDDAQTAYSAMVYVLNGGTFMGCIADPDSSGNVLGRAVAAPAGQVPRWGRSGEFLLEVGSLRLRVVVGDNMLGNHLPVELWAVDLDQPFVSETGYRSSGLTVTSCMGKTVDQALKALVLGILAHEGRPKPIRPDEVERMRRAKAPSWLADALAGIKPDGQLAMFGDAPAPKAPKSNALRQKELRARRKAQQVKPLLLTESERDLIAHVRAQGEVMPGAVPIMLTHTDRCVMSLGLLAHEDLDHRNADWEVTKKPNFDALLRRLWPEGDGGRYLAEPHRSNYRPSAYLHGEARRHRMAAELAREEMTKLSRRVQELESALANIGAAVSGDSVANTAPGNGADLAGRVKALEREQVMLESERNKAFAANKTLTERLRRAGLCTDYRPQPGE